jgi:branched-subunit amino acid ABC-type transport system permease component
MRNPEWLTITYSISLGLAGIAGIVLLLVREEWLQFAMAPILPAFALTLFYLPFRS